MLKSSSEKLPYLKGETSSLTLGCHNPGYRQTLEAVQVWFETTTIKYCHRVSCDLFADRVLPSVCKNCKNCEGKKKILKRVVKQGIPVCKYVNEDPFSPESGGGYAGQVRCCVSTL